MGFLPGRDGIIDDLLIVCALAQGAFVTPENFSAVPYLQHLLRDRSSEALIERLLAMAIKTRFLDDQTGLLKEKDRRQILIGKYFDGGVEKNEEICIRLALNKLVHHDKIAVRVENWGAIVVGHKDEQAPGMKLIPPGPHRGKRVIVSVEGSHRGRDWQFDIDLYKLVDEVLRVLE
jgi:hypothetical protein